MSIQVLHTADNHLDISAAKFGPKRFERKADFLRCFEAAVDFALKEKPDLLLISGDLYDTVQPRNVPRSVMMKHFRSLHDAGIKVYMISGHHDTARSVEQGASPLAIYGESGYALFFSNYLQPQSTSFERYGLRVELTGISYNPNLHPGDDPFSQLRFRPKGDVNILMFHYPLEGFKGFFATSEPSVRKTSLPTGFQLVAAGHLHQHQRATVGESVVVYPGSTERASFSEEGEEKGFAWLEIGKQGVLSEEFVRTPARPMRTESFEIPRDGNINDLLANRLAAIADPELVMRVRLRGLMSLKQLPTYSRPRIQSVASERFFAAEIDDSEIEIEAYGQVEPLPRTTPLQELERYFEGALAKASEEEKQLLREALKLSMAMLQEAGAW